MCVFLDHPWNSCAFSATMERDFIKFHLGPNLWEAGYTPDKFNLMMLDHNRFDLPDWVDAVYRDPEAAKYVAGAAIHFYYNGPYGPELFDEVLAEFPDKFIMYTEASYVDGLDVIGFGNWWMGEMYMRDMLDDMTHSVTGWVDWNLALDMEGGPNWSYSHRVAPVHVDATRQEWYKNPVWHALGHLSKFIIPGSIHLGDMVGDADDHFKVGVFERPDFAITVVIMNESDEEHDVVLSDPFRGDATIHVPGRTWSSLVYY